MKKISTEHYRPLKILSIVVRRLIHHWEQCIHRAQKNKTKQNKKTKQKNIWNILQLKRKKIEFEISRCACEFRLDTRQQVRKQNELWRMNVSRNEKKAAIKSLQACTCTYKDNDNDNDNDNDCITDDVFALSISLKSDSTELQMR